mmetsp:Transcript_98102/g.179709  ORF Transcript_98102/g.179709 Transcript_98102/m.179709 type:complete len:218 (+) Transcript_98102:557-1210(+)
MRVITFIVLSLEAPLALANFCLAASKASSISLVCPRVMMSRYQAPRHLSSSVFSKPAALRLSIDRAPFSCFALKLTNAFSASSICFLNLLWITLSPWILTYQPVQAEKTVCRRVLSSLLAMFIKTLFVFAFCWAPNAEICAWSAVSCCCAFSASSWQRARRFRRSSTFLCQLSRRFFNSEICIPASMTHCLRICWLTPVSPSSMQRATSSGIPSSKA